MRVYVLLFNVGTDNEGIHTLKLKDDDRNVVLMFESEEDATRYGLLLEAQDFMVPSVEAIESEEVEEFCAEASYECVFVPNGKLTIPPESNMEKTDWEVINEQLADTEKISDGEDQPAMPTSELEAIRRRLEGLL